MPLDLDIFRVWWFSGRSGKVGRKDARGAASWSLDHSIRRRSHHQDTAGIQVNVANSIFSSDRVGGTQLGTIASPARSANRAWGSATHGLHRHDVRRLIHRSAKARA